MDRTQLESELRDASWSTSTTSPDSGASIAVARLSDGSVAMRDGGDADGPVLIFTPVEWRAFVAGVDAGEFDAFGR